jgi:hypothetical protein
MLNPFFVRHASSWDGRTGHRLTIGREAGNNDCRQMARDPREAH